MHLPKKWVCGEIKEAKVGTLENMNLSRLVCVRVLHV